MKNFLFKLFTFIFILLGISIFSNVSANPADMDPSFDTGVPIGFDNGVESILQQLDGKIIVGGHFTTYQGTTVNGIVRLNQDGSKDTLFNLGSGFNNSVTSMGIQSDGKIIIGGGFQIYNGQSVNRIIRLNSDGSIDNSFDTGLGFNSYVYSLLIQSDGKIIVGGDFSTYQGESANRIIRLNSDGSIDNSFNIGTGLNSRAWSFVQQSDGKIIVGGEFTNYQGFTANRIIRLNQDGSIDNSLNVGSGFNGNIRSIALQSDGKIIIGGEFTNYQGSTANRIIRLNSDGSIDNSFDTGLGFNSYVYSLLIQSDGKIIAGGLFTNYQGESANRIIRLNSGGNIDLDFNMGAGFDFELSERVSTIFMQNDGKIIIGGAMSSYQSRGIGKIVRLNSDGGIDDLFNLGNGFNREIVTQGLQSDGKIIVGGWFKSYNGVSVNHIARLDTDGGIDTGFDIGTGFDHNVVDLEIQDNDKIVVGGYFNHYNGVSVNHIARLNIDGSIDTEFNVGDGFNNDVFSLALQPDGKIIVGGLFTAYQGESINRVIRLNIDGSRDTGFNVGNGFNNRVWSIEIQPDGKIIVGGEFTTYDGLVRNSIVRLNTDGSIDTGFDIGSGFFAAGSQYTPYAIEIQPDGKIIVGGYFDSYNGVTSKNIVRLNTNGSIDTGFNIGNGFNSTVFGLKLQLNGKILVCGSFGSFNNTLSNSVMRLNIDGSRDTGFDDVLGFTNRYNSYLKTIGLTSDGEIFLGGTFSWYGNKSVGYLIKLYGDNNSSFVLIPNSTDTNTVETEFTDKGYVKSGIDLIGTTAISLEITDGLIPVSLNLKNENIQLNIPSGIQFKKKSDNSNYDGIISVPILPSTSTYSIFDKEVITRFKVGSSSEATILEGGVAILRVPVTGREVGDIVYIYYAEDNGVSRYPKTQAVVQEENGDLYVEFSTDQLTEFSVLDASASVTSFTINNDDTATTGLEVELSIESTGIVNMRFSNDNTNRSSRESFATTKSWTLSNGGGEKTVYAEFDINDDETSDIQTNDTIQYNEPDTTAPIGSIVYSPNIATTGNVTATISLDETGTITNNGGSTTYIFTGNGNFTYEFEDEAGNTGEAIATVNWIDREVPVINGVTSGGTYTTTARFTITDNVAVSGVMLNGTAITGRTNATINTIGIHTIIATDTAGNETIINFEIQKKKSSGGGGGSYYVPEETEEVIEDSKEEIEETASEIENAYEFAKEKKITTTKDIDEFDTDGVLIRKHLAKMISEFAKGVMGKAEITGAIVEGCNNFEDMENETEEMKGYAKMACKLGLMGWNSDQKNTQKTFNPDIEINRAQFGTILSRLLRGSTYATEDSLKYYEKHLMALNTKGIMKVIEPEMRELRGWVILMLYRVRENRDK